MKHHMIMAATVLCLFSSVAAAQKSYSGYFLDGHSYRYRMNPAFGNEKTFISMPALGNIDLALDSDIMLSSVLYNLDGKTVFFFHPDVPESEAMSKFGDRNDLKLSLDLSVFSAGFKAFGGYNTITLNAHVNGAVGLPGAVFSLAKEGIGNRRYDLSTLHADAAGYAELAIGHSHDITAVPGLRIGAALKFLVGLAYVESDIRQAEINLGEDKWIASTDGDVYMSMLGAAFKSDVNEDGRRYISGIEMDNLDFTPAGYGFGVDLGAAYRFSDFEFSAAVNNLGFIKYNNVRRASTDGVHQLDSDRFVFNADKDASNSFEKVSEEMLDDLAALYELQDKGSIGVRTGSLTATLNLGVDYALPVYRKLHFGLLNTTDFDKGRTFNTTMLSANIAPLKSFSASVNAAIGSFGVSYGAMLSFHATGFNSFVGVDRIPAIGSLPNLRLNLGFNILF